MRYTWKWGLIGLVATCTSFTAYNSLFDPANPHGTTIYLALGLFLLVATLFISVLQVKRGLQQDFNLKIGLQEGMKTALFIILPYSVNNYFYLSSFNPSVIEKLVNAQIENLNAAEISESRREVQLKAIYENMTPFKKVTQDLLRLLSISSMTTFISVILVKKFPI